MSISSTNMNLPKVSIITPSYNQGEFIESTIQSVLSQDYENLEYIIVDGGSTDNTLEIIRKYDGRLRWISEKDNGPEDAVNKGFRMSSGDLLGWLASDDTYLPGTISTVVNFIRHHPDVGMVYGKAHYIDATGGIVWDYPTAPFDYKALAVYNIICQPAALFRRDAFFDAGGLSLDVKYASDYDLWLRIAPTTRIAYLPVFLATYRLHRQSKTMMDTDDPLERMRECLEIVIKYYDWAPLNRVYPYCYYRVKSSLPSFLARWKPLVVSIALLVSTIQYCRLNRGINWDDLKLFPSNIRKLLHGWELKDILRKTAAGKNGY